VDRSLTDDWLLRSIRLGGRKGATLRDIIAAGDYLNHAIFTKEELRGGLSSLLRAGVVVKRGEKWFAPQRAPASIKRGRIAVPGDGQLDEAIREYLKPPVPKKR
jgi:hypothetical protein